MELWAGLCLMEGKVQEEESAEKKKRIEGLFGLRNM